MDQGRMVGIITERDVLRSFVKTRKPLTELLVADFMTADVVTGTPEDDVEDAMGLMTRRRIRHLPILDDNRLAGLISIGDVVKAQHDTLSLENHFMKSYIQG
jgi:CBS domain-containing protein